jgi:uncharacterized Zn finger protein (UPF0148 family)
MEPQSLNCPSCGAPLQCRPDQPLVICVYCNATVRVPAEESPAAASVEVQLSDKDMALVKQLLLDGRKEEAMQLYLEGVGVDAQEAQAALENLGSQLSLDIVRRQQLNRVGWGMVIFFTLLLIASAVGSISGWLNGWVALILTGVCAAQLYYFAPALRTTARFWRAKVAPAVTLKVAPIGRIKRQGQDIFTVKVLLEVRPAGEEHFQAEMALPVREVNIVRALPGKVIQVKYLAEDRNQIIYDE